MSEDRLESVAAADWPTAVRAARDEGFSFLDFLTAVDQCDAPEDPGFDVTVRLLDPSQPGALRGIRLTTRIPGNRSATTQMRNTFLDRRAIGSRCIGRPSASLTIGDR